MDRYFLFSVLKQMRFPIIMMIMYYAISIIGLLFINGVDDQGNDYRLGIFHAIYIVVYTSTTIGFGEIPYAWTDNQRLWVIIISFSGVVFWVYSMGKLISLSQNKIFKDSISQYRFESIVLKNKKPFYIMCGFGVTGKKILDLMDRHEINIVLIDNRELSFSGMEQISYKQNTPYVLGDCSNINVLKSAGLRQGNCHGVIIITGDESVNVKTAISCKLLEPNKKIFVRAYEKEHIRNLSSFGTEHIISEANLFYKDISLLLSHINIHYIKKKIDTEIKKYSNSSAIPDGKWLICGLNSTTSKIATHLINNNIEFSIVTKKEPTNKLLKSYCVYADGLSEDDLIQAGVKDVSVVFSAHDDDFKNLSTLITSKALNNNLYTIAIQNNFNLSELFNKVKIDLILQPQIKVAAKIHSLISEPFLNDFYNELLLLDNECGEIINNKIPDGNLITWHFRINEEKQFYKEVLIYKVYLSDLIPHLHDIFPLMIIRENGQKLINPSLDTILIKNDVILFTGKNESFCRQRLMMYNKNIYKEYKIRKDKG